MDFYVCLLFNSVDGAIVRAEIIACARKADCIPRANELLRQTAEAGGYELWLRGEKVYSSFTNQNGNSSQTG